MAHFDLRMTPCREGDANFLVLGTDLPTCLIFCPDGIARDAMPNSDPIGLSAQVSWGGRENPLLAALPSCVRQDLAQDPDTRSLAQLLLSEQAQKRCGSASALNRLGEVLILRLMRMQIEHGAVSVGLLGGLADPRLSRAIVAMHEHPGKLWQVDTLAAEAGLSVSRFAQLFREAVGVTPLAYLRRWRLTLAQQDIARGDRIKSVAARYGYGSTEALSRAIRDTYGASPLALRKQSA